MMPPVLRVITGGQEPYTDDDDDLEDVMFGQSARNLLPSRTLEVAIPAGTSYAELALMVRAELLRDFPPAPPPPLDSVAPSAS